MKSPNEETREAMREIEEKRDELDRYDDAEEIFETLEATTLARRFMDEHEDALAKMAKATSITEETMDIIDRSLQNMKRGIVSGPVDLDKEYPDLD